MKTKLVKSLAPDLSAMAISSRVLPSLEQLCSLPDGTVTLDLVSNTAKLSDGQSLELLITAELSDWLRERLAQAAIPVERLEAAKIDLSYGSHRIPTNRSKIVAFDLGATANVLAADRVSTGTAEGMQWYKREAA